MRELSSLSGFPAALFAFRSLSKANASTKLVLGRPEQDDGAFIWKCLEALLKRGYRPQAIYSDGLINGRGFPAPLIRQTSIFDESGVMPDYRPSVTTLSAGDLSSRYAVEHFFDQGGGDPYGHSHGIVVSPLIATLLLEVMSTVFLVYEGPRIHLSSRALSLIECLGVDMASFDVIFEDLPSSRVRHLKEAVKRPKSLRVVELVDAKRLNCICCRLR